MIFVLFKSLFALSFSLSFAYSAPNPQIRYVWYLEQPTDDLSNVLIEFSVPGQKAARDAFALGYEKDGKIIRIGQPFRARRFQAYMSNVEEATYIPDQILDDEVRDYEGHKLFAGEVINIFADPRNPTEVSAQIRRSRAGQVEEQINGMLGDLRVHSRMIRVPRLLDPSTRGALVYEFPNKEGLSFRKDGTRAGDVLLVIRGQPLKNSHLTQVKLVIGRRDPGGIKPLDFYPGVQDGTVVYLTHERDPKSTEFAVLKFDTDSGLLTVLGRNQQVTLTEVAKTNPEDPTKPSIHAYSRALEEYKYATQKINGEHGPQLVRIERPSYSCESLMQLDPQPDLFKDFEPAALAVGN